MFAATSKRPQRLLLREHFVLEKIAEDLSIEPTEAEYDAEIELIAQQSEYDEKPEDGSQDKTVKPS
jgi:FKBP-type peptidyl-prolyl cis-trans isomerase (trigger factor)